MNILYLAHRIPYPPDKGDKLRAYRQIEYLARKHRVWCACFVDSPSEHRHLASLRECCVDVAGVELHRNSSTLRGVIGLARGRTLTESYYHSPEMYDVVRAMCGRVGFDVAVAFSSSMATYALRIPARRRVLDLCDCDSQKWLAYSRMSKGPWRWAYRTEGRRLAQRERAWLAAFDATIVITEAEARPLKRTASNGRLHIVGNGMPLPDALSTTRPIVPTVGFVGVMDYRPNVDAVCWFVDECWGAIREAHPEAMFRIVGRSPVRRVRRLSGVPGVQVVGGVDEVGWELNRLDVSVAPMRIARGLQNKVLEAMAAGKPVVLTKRAAEGIDGHSGREYLVADSAEAIIRDVRRLLRDGRERDRIGRAARRFVGAHHRWSEVLEKFELIVTGSRTRSVAAAPVYARTAQDSQQSMDNAGPASSAAARVAN